MLLNVSNHPSDKWPAPQQEAARAQYGEVQDLPFPQIAPEADTDQVRQLAEQYTNKIRKIAPNTVHIMGEMTFTCTLVNALQSIGIPCIASTTRRQVLEEADGKKTSVFEFVRFREYASTLPHHQKI